jgi:hypothetical protein
METAETTNYMILGFAVIFGVLFIHLASFAVRKRNLAADLRALQASGRRSPVKRKAKAKRKKR